MILINYSISVRTRNIHREFAVLTLSQINFVQHQHTVHIGLKTEIILRHTKFTAINKQLHGSKYYIN